MAASILNSSSYFLYLSSSVLILSSCCDMSYGVDLFLGAYGPIDNEDTMIVAAAKFAVSEHNKHANTSLEFVRIVDGLQAIVAGANYMLVILAKHGGSQTYDYYGAYLYDGCWKNYTTLYYFNRMRFAPDQGQPPAIFVGAYEPIDNLQDPMVVEAAKFAVAERANKTMSMEFVRVVDGEAQVDGDITYKLVILVKDGSTYDAVVNVRRRFFKHGQRKFITLHSFEPLQAFE